MKKLSIISLAVLAFSLQSCRKDYLYVEPVVPPPANLSFATDVYPILSSATYSCTGCHPGSSAPDFSSASNAFTDLTTGTAPSGGSYLNLSSPSLSKFYIAVTPAYTGPTGQMPGNAPYLSANEQSLILAWITQGAKP